MMHDATFVDPDDNPIDAFAWAALIQQHGLVLVLAETTLPTPVGQLIVRTTWCGLHLPGQVQPFGTASATQPDGPWSEIDQYATRAAALAGHASFVAGPDFSTGGKG